MKSKSKIPETPHDGYIRCTSLNNVIMAEIKQTNKSCYKLITRKKTPYWIPSKRNTVYLCLFYLLLGFIFHIQDFIKVNFISQNLTIYNNSSAIAIVAGIGAVIVGLSFFVAQSFFDKDEPDRGRVLLYTSNFYLLLTGIIFSLIILLFGTVNYLIYLMIFSIGILSFYHLSRTIRVSISIKELENSKLHLLTNVLNKYFIHEIQRKMGYYIISEYEKKLKEKYPNIMLNFLFSNDSQDFILFQLKEKGTLNDINLKQLAQLISELHKRIPRSAESKIEKLIFIPILPYQQVSDQTTYLAIRKEVFHSANKQQIEKRINGIFKIENYDYDEEASLELSRLKQRSLTLVKQERLEELKFALETYNGLIQELLDIFDKINFKLTSEQARQQRYSMPGDRLNSIDIISEDIYDVFIEGIKSKNHKIVKQCAYLPKSITRLSIEKKDNLIYQNFIRYPLYLYEEHCKQIKRKDYGSSQFVLDYSWRYLNDIIDFNIKFPFENRKIGIDEFFDYLFYAIKVYQDLIKISFDNRDYKNFILYITKLNEKIGKLLYLDYETQQKVVSLLNEALFGLGSWISNIFLNSETDCLKYVQALLDSLVVGIEELSEIFLIVSSYNRSQEWGWDDWEMESQKEGRGYKSQLNDNLEAYYIIASLKALSKIPAGTIQSIHLPIKRDFALSINSITEHLEIIKNNIRISSLIQLGKLDLFLMLLQRVKNQFEEYKCNVILSTNLSESKVSEFSKDVIQSINSKERLKSIFSSNLEVINYINHYGIRITVDKENFLPDNDDLNNNMSGLVEFFSEPFVDNENSHIISLLRNNSLTMNINQLEKELDTIVDLSSIRIITNLASYELYDMQNSVPSYIPEGHPDFDKVSRQFSFAIGITKYGKSNIPIYEMYHPKREPEILLFDLARIKFKQFVDQNGQDLSVEVLEIKPDSELESQLLNKSPEWLETAGDISEKKLVLQKKVIVQVQQNYMLEVEEGAVIKFLFYDNDSIDEVQIDSISSTQVEGQSIEALDKSDEAISSVVTEPVSSPPTDNSPAAQYSAP